MSKETSMPAISRNDRAILTEWKAQRRGRVAIGRCIEDHTKSQVEQNKSTRKGKKIIMTKLMNQFRRTVGQTSLAKDERGLSTVEYVIILVLIAAAAVGAWTTLGNTVRTKIGDSNTKIGEISIPADAQGKAAKK